MGVAADFLQYFVFSFVQLLVSLIQLALSPVSFLLDRLAARPKTAFSSVLVTGASSGLGEGLAVHYARRGVNVAITGRNKERLEKVAQRCRDKGASVRIGFVDVTDREPLLKFIESVDAAAPLDLVIANAGISGFVESDDDSYTFLQSAINVTTTNALGVVHTIFPAMAAMCQRRRGQVVIMGSLSGNMPLQASPEYGASKAYVASLSRALRKYLATYNVGLTLLAPGFVRTPLLRSPHKYPMEISLEEAMDKMTDAIDRDVGFVAFPGVPGNLTMWLGSMHPITFNFLGRIMTRLSKKVKTRLTLTEAEAAKKRK